MDGQHDAIRIDHERGAGPRIVLLRTCNEDTWPNTARSCMIIDRATNHPDIAVCATCRRKQGNYRCSACRQFDL